MIHRGMPLRGLLAGFATDGTIMNRFYYLGLTAWCSLTYVSFGQSPTPPSTQPAPAAMTYCNPLSIPNYPVGKRCRDVIVGSAVDPRDGLWLVDRKEQFRELADVSVLWHENKWYMYPSVDMAWVSSDNGVTWQHHPLNIRDIGYAPTIVRHRGKFLLMASDSAVHVADSPLGPFEPIGK